MSAPTSLTAANLQWFVRHIRLGGLRVPVGRILLDLCQPLGKSRPYPRPFSAWFDTAAPLSVIPFRLQGRGLVWHPLPGIQTTWFGQQCDVGHLEVWLLDQVSSTHRGPFRMLAKFPRRDPPGNPSPLLVGLEFVLAHQGPFHMPTHPSAGELRVL